jgi:hypothetical protein
MEHAELMPTFLLDTNITPIQKNKMLAASCFTFSLVQFYSTCNLGGTDNKKQLTIIKPTQTGINCNK